MTNTDNEVKENTSRKEEARTQLMTLSGKVRKLVNDGKFDTINQAVIEKFYKNDSHQVFKKFREWKEEGMSIIKGSKGFPVWARPLSVLRTEAEQETDDEESKFHPICYLFSNAQVKERVN